MRVTGQHGNRSAWSLFSAIALAKSSGWAVKSAAASATSRARCTGSSLARAILVARPPGRCGNSRRAEASVIIRHPARLLASARAIRRLITASASFRWSRHIRSLDSARSAGNLKRRPAQAGQPGRGPQLW